MINKKKNWYSVRCLFRLKKRKDMSKKYLYEERITLWYTTSLDEAIKLAEEEAADYASSDSKYLNFAQGFWLFDAPGHSKEIFSLLRECDLKKDDYITKFFDSGYEREQAEN